MNESTYMSYKYLINIRINEFGLIASVRGNIDIFPFERSVYHNNRFKNIEEKRSLDKIMLKDMVILIALNVE